MRCKYFCIWTPNYLGEGDSHFHLRKKPFSSGLHGEGNEPPTTNYNKLGSVFRVFFSADGDPNLTNQPTNQPTSYWIPLGVLGWLYFFRWGCHELWFALQPGPYLQSWGELNGFSGTGGMSQVWCFRNGGLKEGFFLGGENVHGKDLNIIFFADIWDIYVCIYTVYIYMYIVHYCIDIDIWY